jgi:hypothetical protein
MLPTGFFQLSWTASMDLSPPGARLLFRHASSSLGGFHEGLASAWMADRPGFIDESGKFVIPPQFQYARAFENGLADVELNDRWGFINKNGTFVISARYVLPQLELEKAFFR